MNIKINRLIALTLIMGAAIGLSACKKTESDTHIETPQEFTQGNTGKINQEFKTARIETNLSDNVFKYKLGRVAEGKKDVNIKLITKLDKTTKEGLYIYEIDFNGDIDFPNKMLESKMVPNVIKDIKRSDVDDVNQKMISAITVKMNELGNVSVNINEINLEGNPIKEKIKNVDPKLFRPIGNDSIANDVFENEEYDEKTIDFMSTYSDVGFLIKNSKVIGAAKYLDNVDQISFLMPMYGYQYDRDVLLNVIKDLPPILNKDGKKMDHIAMNIPKFSVGSITFKEEDGADPVPNPDGKKTESIMYNKPFIAVITEKTSAGNVIKAISVIKNIE